MCCEMNRTYENLILALQIHFDQRMVYGTIKPLFVDLALIITV